MFCGGEAEGVAVGVMLAVGVTVREKITLVGVGLMVPLAVKVGEALGVAVLVIVGVAVRLDV